MRIITISNRKIALITTIVKTHTQTEEHYENKDYEKFAYINENCIKIL
jgi:hypothetical protein